MRITAKQAKGLGLEVPKGKRLEIDADQYAATVRETWTEAEFTKQIIAVAQEQGWLCAHFRPARTRDGWRTPCQADAKGWPDLFMVRNGAIIVAELKIGSRKATKDQAKWLTALSEVPGCKCYVWTPRDWESLRRSLLGS